LPPVTAGVKRVLLCILAAALVAGVFPPATSAARDRCALPGSKTLLDNGRARVYERSDVLYGCDRLTGRHRRLARQYLDDIFLLESWVDPLLNERFVAWRDRRIDASCKAECPPDYDAETTSIVAVDLRTGSRRAVPYEGTVVAHAVSRTGGLAFLIDRRELWVADGGGRRVVELAEIEPASLRMRRSTLTWESGGERRSRPVDGGTTCRPRLGGTRAWNDVGRVYQRGDVLVGCTWFRSRSARLTSAPAEHVAMAGRFAAWAERGAVVVHDLLYGREIRPAAGTVVDLAIGGDGLVAWLEADGSLFAGRGLEPVLLDRGAIEPGSLLIQRGFVTWRRDGAMRGARPSRGDP
jgi:hypothetical protein